MKRYALDRIVRFQHGDAIVRQVGEAEDAGRIELHVVQHGFEAGSALAGGCVAARPGAAWAAARQPLQGSGRGHDPGDSALCAARWRAVLATTWQRTSDIVTIVTPLLVAGSVLLALLTHFGADRVINVLLLPITSWWLGLPALLGVPILFGVLRKELSLLMVYQALGTMDIVPLLDWLQIATFLVFLTFYIPCVSTFAVMLRSIG
jgi:hypothetical protein